MNVITPGISIVIRTLNEERFLGDCLSAIEKQVVDLPLEVIVVDSGSVDRTREIATGFGCILVSIPQGSFTFGRSLNIGVAKAQYEYVISISAHCVPVGANWLENLVKPLSRSAAELVYGAQKASITSRSSEIGYFSDRFRGQCGTRSEPEFNNGNSAFLKSIWSIRGFDEGLPAQEDVEFSQWHMKNSSATLYYSSKATVVHHHNDRNRTLYNRLYRELAVEFYLGRKSLFSLLFFSMSLPRYLVSDLAIARKKGALLKASKGILAFRAVQASAFLHAAISYKTYTQGITSAAR